MQVHVRLAEPFWRQVGQRNITVELAKDANTVGDLLASLRERYPPLTEEMEDLPPLIILDEEEVGVETMLEDGSRIHLLWAVAGG